MKGLVHLLSGALVFTQLNTGLKAQEHLNPSMNPNPNQQIIDTTSNTSQKPTNLDSLIQKEGNSFTEYNNLLNIEEGFVKVDGGLVHYNKEDRNYMIACIISEIGDWEDTDYQKLMDKTIAMSYVILRRAKDGNFGGGHNIKDNILAPKQFYGMTLLSFSNIDEFKGKFESHSVLSILDPEYKKNVESFTQKNPALYMRSILDLITPGDTTDERVILFRRVVETVRDGVDAVLSGKKEDTSKGAEYWGYVGDIFASKNHMPDRMVAVIGGLGYYKTVEDLLNDSQIESDFYQSYLWHNGVDAMFFFK